LKFALRPQTSKHFRGGWSHFTDTSPANQLLATSLKPAVYVITDSRKCYITSDVIWPFVTQLGDAVTRCVIMPTRIHCKQYHHIKYIFFLELFDFNVRAPHKFPVPVATLYNDTVHFIIYMTLFFIQYTWHIGTWKFGKTLIDIIFSTSFFQYYFNIIMLNNQNQISCSRGPINHLRSFLDHSKCSASNLHTTILEPQWKWVMVTFVTSLHSMFDNSLIPVYTSQRFARSSVLSCHSTHTYKQIKQL
jgi:hypothetical protein